MDLKTEIRTDPLGLGYAQMGDKQILASLTNASRERNRVGMTGSELAAVVDSSAYDSLTDAKKLQFLSLVASENIDPFGFAANVVKDIFGAGSATVQALAAARVETISRSDELGIPRILGKELTAEDIAKARS